MIGVGLGEEGAHLRPVARGESWRGMWLGLTTQNRSQTRDRGDARDRARPARGRRVPYFYPQKPSTPPTNKRSAISPATSGPVPGTTGASLGVVWLVKLTVLHKFAALD